jgi:hypothetical protein
MCLEPAGLSSPDGLVPLSFAKLHVISNQF